VSWFPAAAFLVGVIGATLVIADKLRKPPAPPTGSGDLCCSFCGKSQREVKKLIAGPAVYICDECVRLCIEIIQEDDQKPPIAVKPAEHEWSPPEKE
jgi:hypothetical protein